MSGRARLVVASLLLFFASSFLMVGVSDAAAAASAKSGAKAGGIQPQRGGALKIITKIGAVSLGYPAGDGPSNDLVYSAPAVETLLRVNEKGETIPWLATGWKIAPDFKSVALVLRKGVKFHDGTSFNAQAVKGLLDDYRTSPKAELKSVTSIDVLDDYTVRLNVARLEGGLLSSLAARAGLMVSPTALKGQGKEWALSHPVGTGPFKFVSWQKDVSVKYEKFDGYWQKGKPYLDRLEFDFINDPVTAKMAFQAGEAQVLFRIDPKDVAELQRSGGYEFAKCPGAGMALVGDSGHQNSPFADVRVRKAVQHAIDTKTISDSLWHGLFPAVNQPAAAEHWYYSPAVVGYPYNPAKAKELLAQAGYQNGFKTRIMFPSTVPGGTDLWSAVQGYLGRVGIEAVLEPATDAAHAKNYTGGWDNGLIYISLSVMTGQDPGMNLVNTLSERGKKWVSVIHPADFESSLSDAIVEPDPKKAKTRYQALMKLIIDQHCLTNPVVMSTMITASTRKVHGLGLTAIALTQWTPEETWLSK